MPGGLFCCCCCGLLPGNWLVPGRDCEPSPGGGNGDSGFAGEGAFVGIMFGPPPGIPLLWRAVMFCRY